MFKRVLKLLSGLPSLRKREAIAVRACSLGHVEIPSLRADYPACDTCNAFLTVDENSGSTCHRCANKRHGPRPVRAAAAHRGVDLYLPWNGMEGHKFSIRADYRIAADLSSFLLKPESDDLNAEFKESHTSLAAAWRYSDRSVMVSVIVSDREIAAVLLSEAQARRLGEDIAECIWPECDHEFVDARNERVISGEICMRCGVMRAGNG